MSTLIHKQVSAKRKGYYFGTEIDEIWCKRYVKDKLLARGSGTFWRDRNSFNFLRYLTKTPISISFKDITELKVGTWHAGKWGAGKSILKILWIKDGKSLSSGFITSKDHHGVEALLNDLQVQIDSIKRKKQDN